MKTRLLFLAAALSFAVAQLPCERVHAQANSGSAASAKENEAAAREAFSRGRIHYDNGEFDRASEAFEQAYKLSGRDALLYNLYLAYRDANQQEKAAEALRTYLAKVEVVENRAQLESRLKALDEGIAQRKSSEEAKRATEQNKPEPALASSVDAGQPVEAVPQNDRWWLMPVAVMGVGGALMLGSLGTGVMASSKQKELEDKCEGGVCTEPGLKSTADEGKTLALVTDVLLFGGIATAATGAVLFFVKRPSAASSAASDTPTASVGCTRSACGGSMSFRF